MQTPSRPVWGAWIEIENNEDEPPQGVSRAPYGARGLKFSLRPLQPLDPRSRPVWGAWIEMLLTCPGSLCESSRAPYGARGLKCYRKAYCPKTCCVAPRMGRVD